MQAGDADPRALILVEGPDAPVVTLQRSLTPRLDVDTEQQLVHRILTDYWACLSDRSEWERRLVEWEAMYYNKTEEKVFPWPGAANFHVPITMTGVEVYKPRLVEGVLGQQPPIIVQPTTGALEDRKEKVEKFLNWQIMSEMKIEATVAESAHLFMEPGLAIAKIYWLSQRKRRKFIREFPAETPLPAIFEAVFGLQAPVDLKVDGDLAWKGRIPGPPSASGPLEVYFRLNFLEDETEPTVQILVEKDEIIERPQVDLIDPTDFIVPVKGGGDPNELPYCGQRLWLNEEALRRKAQAGIFYPDVVEDLITSGPPRGDQPTTDSGAYRASVDATEGVEGMGPSNVRRTQWEILEFHMKWDIDEDGFEEDIIVWIPPNSGVRKILGWDYLDNVYAHGRRPFRAEGFFRVPFRWYGLSFAEIVKPIQDEINAIHNQRVDYGTIQNLPWFGYRADSTLPGITPELRPGQGIALNNPANDLVFPKWQGDAAWGQQEEAVLMQYFERLTGISDLSIGRQPNRVGATRTAAGTQTLLSEQGLRYKGVMTAFQRLWIGIFNDILALDQAYLPPNKEFRVTGKRPTAMAIKDRSEIAGQFDLRVVATNETTNRQRMREDATAIVQATTNPLLLQSGQVGMKGVRHAMEKFYKSYGEDPDFYLEPQAPILDPDEELGMMAAGETVDPVFGENVEIHLAKHQLAMEDPAVGADVKRLLGVHIQKTYQLIQQMMMAQQQAQMRPGAQVQGPQAGPAQQGAVAPQPEQPAVAAPPAGNPVGQPG